ncbi:MAG: tetratricopeptide repeat protein [Pyrinomonadaceae bacterium]|nr:tetratricopeptide repeat protein [Pyrinomonadaceae bacterium]
MLRLFLIAPLLILLSHSTLYAQGGTDYTGTGGKHTIQGRIFFPSGRRADITIKVKLESMNAGNLSVFADSYGSFSFKNLVGGSYTVVIDANEYYEGVQESVFIDDGGNQASRTIARTQNVQIHLQPKLGAEGKPGVVNAALVNVPKKAIELYGKAIEFIQANELKKAVEYLNKTLAIHADFPLALNELGVLYLRLREPGKAVTPLASAVRLAPDDFDPRLNYGIALLSVGEFEKAEAELRQALRKNDGAATAHMYLGMTLLRLSRFDEAQIELLRATSLPGGDRLADAYKYLGGLYWKRGEYQQAADALEKYVKLAPKASDAEQIRGTIKEFRSRKN